MWILSAQDVIHKDLREQRSSYSDQSCQQARDKDEEGRCPGILETAFYKSKYRSA